jgi:hypothetical protein
VVSVLQNALPSTAKGVMVAGTSFRKILMLERVEVGGGNSTTFPLQPHVSEPTCMRL